MPGLNVCIHKLHAAGPPPRTTAAPHEEVCFQASPCPTECDTRQASHPTGETVGSREHQQNLARNLARERLTRTSVRFLAMPGWAPKLPTLTRRRVNPIEGRRSLQPNGCLGFRLCAKKSPFARRLTIEIEKISLNASFYVLPRLWAFS